MVNAGIRMYELYFDYSSNLPFQVVWTNEEYKLLKEGKIKCHCYCHDWHGEIAQPLIDHGDCRCKMCPCWYFR